MERREPLVTQVTVKPPAFVFAFILKRVVVGCLYEDIPKTVLSGGTVIRTWNSIPALIIREGIIPTELDGVIRNKNKKKKIPVLSLEIIEALTLSNVPLWLFETHFTFFQHKNQTATCFPYNFFYSLFNVNLMIPISYLTSVCSVMED